MLLRTLQRFKEDGRLLWALLAVNAVSIVFGYYYYYDVGQFDAASRYYQEPWAWPFVADSPNAVVLMSVALLWYRFGGRHLVLDSLAFLHMVYVGLWTTYLFLAHPDQLGTFEWGGTNNILFFSHMGMPLEACVLLPDMLRGARARAAAWRAGLMAAIGVWAGVNLWLDYGSPSLRPAPFVDVDASFALGSSLLMLVAWSALAAALFWRTANASPEAPTA